MFKDNKRVIKTSDYIKVTIIFIFVIALTLFLRNTYLKKEAIDNQTSVIGEIVNKTIKDNEIYNYINDNDTSLIYICVSNEDKCKNFENTIKDSIKENYLEDKLIYLDITNVKDKNKFFNEFNNHYGIEGIVNYPTFVYFENGKVKDVLNDDITEKEFINFVRKCELD